MTDDKIRPDSNTLLKQKNKTNKQTNKQKTIEKQIQKAAVMERSQQDKKNPAPKIEFPNIFQSNTYTKTQSPKMNLNPTMIPPYPRSTFQSLVLRVGKEHPVGNPTQDIAS